MTSPSFIALADIIRYHNWTNCVQPFDQDHINALATFCGEMNKSFKRQQWLDYVAGIRGPRGGQLRPITVDCYHESKLGEA